MATQAGPIHPTSIYDEATRLLQRLIQFESVNPPGEEAQVAEFLAARFAQEGLEVELYDAGDGRVSVAGRLRSATSGARKPLLLLSHSDVYRADPSTWSAPPFGAEIRDGVVWGRGAIDIKGLLASHVMATFAVKRSEVPLDRDVVILCVADELGGGERGIQWLDEHHPDALDAEWVMGEGTFSYRHLLDWTRPILTYCPLEKTGLWLRLSTEGAPSHGSVPRPNTAVQQLVRALNRLDAWHHEGKISPVTRRFFDGLQAAGLVESEASDSDLIRILAPSPHLTAMVRDTVTITSVAAGSEPSLVPRNATATVDCRLIPDLGQRSIDDFLAELSAAIDDPGVVVEELLRGETVLSDPDGVVPSAIQASVAELCPEAVVVPMYSTGITDSRVFRRRGVPSYGFLPYMITLEERAGIGGIDERLSLDNLQFSVDVMTRVVEQLCGAGREHGSH